jgi:predicted nucleotide-binding protein (sugar kinase/HSP70/actin superfamily)
MTIEDFAFTKMREIGVVQGYQELQTKITTDIITLEILTHTPILTNTTTDITLEDEKLSEKQIQKANRAIEKVIKKNAKAEEKRYRKMEEAELKAQKKAAKALKSNK